MLVLELVSWSPTFQGIFGFSWSLDLLWDSPLAAAPLQVAHCHLPGRLTPAGRSWSEVPSRWAEFSGEALRLARMPAVKCVQKHGLGGADSGRGAGTSIISPREGTLFLLYHVGAFSYWGSTLFKDTFLSWESRPHLVLSFTASLAAEFLP